MKASIVFLTKNPGKVFQGALRAAQHQRTAWAHEILVIDSGSRDGTVEFVRGHDRVKLVEIAPEEFGHGRTRNLAFAHTTGEFVAFLTHDATPVDEHWLEELVAAVEQAPDVAGAFGRHLAYPDASPFTKRDLQNHFDGFRALPKVVRIDDWARYERDESYRQVLHFFSDNNACIRRSIWEKIHYPEVDFAEDQLWAKLVLEAGYAKAYADGALVYHSHDFGLWELLQRSFDESKALKRLFGYRLVSSIRHVIRGALALTWHDLHHARRERLTLKHWLSVANRPFSNFSRQLGLFLGNRADRLPPALARWLSRDKAMQRGKR